MAKRRKYSKEFKQDCLNYLNSHPDKTTTEVAEALNVDRTLLSRWKREQKASLADGTTLFPGNGNPKDEEIYQLKRQLAELKEENDILKKAAAILSRASR